MSRQDRLDRIATARRRHGLMRDLVATQAPKVAQLDAIAEARALAHDVFAGRLSIAEARAQLRGAA